MDLSVACEVHALPVRILNCNSCIVLLVVAPYLAIGIKEL